MAAATTNRALSRVLALLEARGPVRQNGRQWRCLCPAHDDSTPSLDVCEGNDGRVLVQCRSRGCPAAAIAAALGLTLRDFFEDDDAAGRSSFEDRVVKRYEYRDEKGNVLFETVRLWAPPPKGKDFRQRHMNGNGWAWNLDGCRRVVYRLPELLAAPADRVVYVVEGEKDADNLARAGLTATTSPMGAGKWKPEYSGFFRDRRVVVIPDNDQPGRDHADRVRASLAGVAAAVAVLPLPGLPEKGDVSDWLARVGTAELLGRMADRVLAGLPPVEPPPPPRPWEVPPAQARRDAGITAAELVLREFPPPRYAVENLLPEGVTVLGGKPKARKSWLALLLGWAIAGGHDLDGRKTERGDVLYLALEDNPRRLKDRIGRLGPALKWEVPAGLHIQTEWPRHHDGGLYHIAEWLKARRKSAGLVVVDTLAKFRRPQRGGGNTYAEDYEAVGDIQKLLGEYAVPGLVITHTRKMPAEDPFDELSGTLGLSGAADTLMVLERRRGGDTGTLYATGRDLPDSTIPLVFDPVHCLWQIGKTAEGIDTAGRAPASNAATKLEQCKAWLKDFLREYAHPSGEIEAAGKAAGFSPGVLRDAKVALGAKGSGEVSHRNFGNGRHGSNDWWSGIGDPSTWKRRPPPAAGDSGESRESEQYGSEEIPP